MPVFFIPDGINPLDTSAVHPKDRMGLSIGMADKLGSVGQLIANETLLKGFVHTDFARFHNRSTYGQ